MALNKAALISALTDVFNNPEGDPATAATAIADALDAYVKTATINAPPVTGLSNGGGPVVGSTATWTLS